MPLLMCPQQVNSIHNIYDTFLGDKYTKMKISPRTKTHDNHLDHCVIREAHTAPFGRTWTWPRPPGHAHSNLAGRRDIPNHVLYPYRLQLGKLIFSVHA